MPTSLSSVDGAPHDALLNYSKCLHTDFGLGKFLIDFLDWTIITFSSFPLKPCECTFMISASTRTRVRNIRELNPMYVRRIRELNPRYVREFRKLNPGDVREFRELNPRYVRMFYTC